MADRRAREDDRFDRTLRACDPIRGRVPAGAGIAAAFDLMSALISSEARRAPQRWRRRSRPRAAVAGVVAFALLGAGASVAARQLFVPTGTHEYPPKGMIVGGGPGEILNMAGTDFRRIALKISSDIPYPAAYGAWRDSVISMGYEVQCLPRAGSGRCQWTPRVPAGALHGAFEASAFDAWVLAWRHDTMTGRHAAAAARRASDLRRVALEGGHRLGSTSEHVGAGRHGHHSPEHVWVDDPVHPGCGRG